MAKDDSIRLPVTEFVREIALTAGAEGGRLAINEHMQLCEARREVVEGQLPTRVALLEQTKDKVVPKPWHEGFWGRVLQIVISASILGLAAWLLVTYKGSP